MKFLVSLVALFLLAETARAGLNVCPRMPVATATANNWVSAISASGATTLAQPAFTNISGSVPNSQLATMADLRVKGNVSGGSAVPSDLTSAQVTAFLTQFSSSLQGVVPSSGGGTANYLRADGSWAAPTGTNTGTVSSVTFTGDGTVLSSTPSSAITTTGTLTAALANATARTFLTGPLSGSAAAPTYKALTAPTVQSFTSTGTTTGYLFTISTSSTVAVGDTYTNNAHTFTVLGALTAQSGAVLFTSGSLAPAASGTLARASGSGTSSITFSAATALATYTPPTSPPPLWLEITMVGGGSGGTGTGTSPGAAGAGTASYFGPNILVTGGASAPSSGANGAAGGTASLGSATGTALSGGRGQGGGGPSAGLAGDVMGGQGAASALGGGGGGGWATGAGTDAAANTGSGGGGAGPNSIVNQVSGTGGSAGGYVSATIVSPAVSYPYIIGTGGVGGTAGTSGLAGGAGAAGVLYVREHYQ